MANELFHDIQIPEKKKKKCPFVSIKWTSSVVAESKVKKKNKKKKTQREVSPNSALN